MFDNVVLNGSLKNDLLKTNNIDKDDVTTFSNFYMNQKSTFLVIESNGNNTLNKEIFGFDGDNFNNGFGCVILSVKMSVWRGFAIAIPINGWGRNCYIGQISGGDGAFLWSKVSLT